MSDPNNPAPNTVSANRVNQYMGFVRQMLPTVATILTSLGVISVAQEATIVNIGQTVIGFILSMIGFWWQWKADSVPSITAAMAKLPTTTGIATTDPAVAAAAKEADPSVKVTVNPQ